MEKAKLRLVDATEERQTIQGDGYEVYEKIGPPVGATDWHSHDFYELIYIADGHFASQVGEVVHELRAGDFLLIGKNTLHRYYPEGHRHEDSRRIILWVEEELLRSLAVEQGDLTSCFQKRKAVIYHFPLHYQDVLSGFLMKLAMSELVSDMEPRMRLNMDRGYLLLFFSYLNVLCGKYDYIFSDSAVTDNSIVEEIDGYIANHIEEAITIEEMAAAAHLSKYYFVRRFKELTGVTAHSYLIRRRLIRACELLKSGEEVMNVYGQVGFSDYSVFLRNFRRVYGLSPREYAKT